MGLFLTVLLVASPGADRARELARNKAWDELYLSFASADPKQPSDDRRAIGEALRKGCEALLESDAVMAYSLGERALAFDETEPALLCTARAARGSEQRGAAEEVLRRGLELFPRNGAFALELARLHLLEQDPSSALAVLSRIGKGSPEWNEAQSLAARARALKDADENARRQAEAVEKAMTRERRSGTSLTYESGVAPGGMRVRANARFQFKYFNNQRDFGQRAEYEGRVAAALEEAYRAAKRTLGRAREKPVDVVLYTREEFALHHGTSTSTAIAGYYGDGAIRINDAAEINPANTATLTHEYVHAVIDELSGFRAGRVPIWLNEGLATYVEWQFSGAEGPPRPVAAALRTIAAGKGLPSLGELASRPLAQQPNPPLRYALSGVAARLLVNSGGVECVLGLIEDLGRGERLDAAFQRRFGKSVARFEEELAREVSQL